MATAKQIGEFSLKGITMTFSPGPAASTLVQVNLEGTATGFDFTAGTFTACSAGQKAGTWTWCAASYPDSGDSVTGRGEGVFSTAGANRWRTQGILTISDGRSCVLDGELELASRSWNGRMFERS
ncbi:MAG: hypothetical protein ACT4QA_18980 [Panacagrimonas sp.]